MSPLPSRCSAPITSSTVRESTRVATRKLMRDGEVRLDQAGDDVDAGALRGQHQVHADGAGHLRQAGNALLHVLAFEHHQVGQLVDEDEDVGQRTQFVGGSFGLLGEQAARLLLQLADLLIELVDIAHAVFGQQAQAALHFEHGVSERVGGLLGIGDHRREQVRDALVHAQFDALGIHHDHANLIGRRLVENRHDHGIDHDALARARGAGDEQVRHGIRAPPRGCGR